MKLPSARVIHPAVGILCVITSIAPVTPSSAQPKSQAAPLSTHVERLQGGVWSRWQPLSGKTGSPLIQYSLKQTSAASNRHETWDGKFRNRGDRAVKLKIRCFFVDHRGDQQDTSFTLYVGRKSESAPISNIVPLSFQPIQVKLAEFSYAD